MHDNTIRAVDWLVRAWLPTWLEPVGAYQQAATARDLPEITSVAQVADLSQTTLRRLISSCYDHRYAWFNKTGRDRRPHGGTIRIPIGVRVSLFVGDGGRANGILVRPGPDRWAGVSNWGQGLGFDLV